MDQTNVLNDVISITNVSRGLINENIKKINNIVDTIINLNQTIKHIAGQFEPLSTARKFMFMHTEFISHHTRIRMVTRQIADDIESIRSYLSTFTTGKTRHSLEFIGGNFCQFLFVLVFSLFKCVS